MSICHGPNPADMERGAYLLLEPHKGLADCALIFHEKDAKPIQAAAFILSVQGIVSRLIAVRDFALFEQQDESYRSRVLRTDLPLLAIAPESCPWLEKLSAERIAPADANTLASCIKSAIFPE